MCSGIWNKITMPDATEIEKIEISFIASPQINGSLIVLLAMETPDHKEIVLLSDFIIENYIIILR